MQWIDHFNSLAGNLNKQGLRPTRSDNRHPFCRPRGQKVEDQTLSVHPSMSPGSPNFNGLYLVVVVDQESRTYIIMCPSFFLQHPP